MSDVSLIWVTMDEGEHVASRERVRELAAELDFDAGDVLGKDSKLGAFTKACKARLSYTDASGALEELRASETKRTHDSVTMQITKGAFKVAEWKFFQPRPADAVAGPQKVRWVLRRNLDEDDKQAAQQWKALAEKEYQKLRVEAPWITVRALARAELLRCAVPVLARDSTYFIYNDEIEMAHKIRLFLNECGNRSDMVILPIDDCADYTVFAASADVLLAEELEATSERIDAALGTGRLISTPRKDAWVATCARARKDIARHERRLAASLPQARLSLLRAEQLVSDIPLRPGSFA